MAKGESFYIGSYMQHDFFLINYYGEYGLMLAVDFHPTFPLRIRCATGNRVMMQYFLPPPCLRNARNSYM